MANVESPVRAHHLIPDRWSQNAGSVIGPAVVSIAVLIGGVAYDWVAPFSVAGELIYVLFVMTGIWHRSRATVFVFAGIGSAFALFNFLHLPEIPAADPGEIEINRIMSIVVLWIVAALCFGIRTQLDKTADAERHVRAIVDNVIDGVITITQDGEIVTFNKACERIFGYEPGEVIGHNVNILMPEPYHREHDGYLHNYHTSGHKKIIGIGREVEGKRKDGSVFPLDLSVSEVRFKDHKFFSGLVRDITQRKRAEEEIMRSNEELERYAYVSSHDLQEPLRMVVNFTTMLKEEYSGKQMDDQADEYMRFIVDGGSRMQTLISDLLQYSRIRRDRSELSDIDSQQQTKLALKNLDEAIKESGASVTFEALPTVRANAIRFTSLMQNLISNAIKYRAKDRAPEIRISAGEQANDWLFTVKDNGIGIKTEYQDQVFELFKRLHGKHEYQGTGIGLTMCQKIVESFGGRIWVESAPDQGATFNFTVAKADGEGKRHDE